MKTFTTKGLCQEELAYSYLRFILIILFALPLLMAGCKTEKNEVKPKILYPLGYVRASDEEYARMPKASAALASGTLPLSFFLDVPPVAFNQGQIGSCTSCAMTMDK